MLDIGHGPLLVAVADRPAAIINTAELDRPARVFDLVEARVDLFAQQSLDGCAHDCARLEASGTPVILTIRTTAQGGRFAGSDAARRSAFLAAIAAGQASWVDIENDATIVDDLAATIAGRAGARLIVSHHDFARTPPLE
jgi:3-dehydroquinate dehydratase type I